MLTKDFILCANGKKNHPGAIFTLEVPKSFQDKFNTNPHYTFKVRFNDKWYVSLLTGPDNTSSYSYMGELNPTTGQFRLTTNSKVTNDTWSTRFIRRILAVLWSNQEIKDGFVLHHVGKCGRCGRLLTTPESIERGIGPICDGFI